MPSVGDVRSLFTSAIYIIQNARHMRFVSIVLTKIQTLCIMGRWKKLLLILIYQKLKMAYESTVSLTKNVKVVAHRWYTITRRSLKGGCDERRRPWPLRLARGEDAVRVLPSHRSAGGGYGFHLPYHRDVHGHRAFLLPRVRQGLVVELPSEGRLTWPSTKTNTLSSVATFATA